MRLSREIRCFPRDASLDVRDDGVPLNTWAGSPRRGGGEPFWIVRATVEGRIDATTGYVCDLRKIDTILRDVVVPELAGGLRGSGPDSSVERCLSRVFLSLEEHLPQGISLVELRHGLSPFLSYHIEGDTRMVSVTQSFEFSAAHRLYNEAFGDEENLRVFGKCSNPHGHGHNYVFEVTLQGDARQATGTVEDLPHLQQVVKERVIDHFDHKNLNIECDEFASLNPSVENIARVIWRRLDGAFSRGQLSRVRVWETPKTCAEYDGRDG